MYKGRESPVFLFWLEWLFRLHGYTFAHVSTSARSQRGNSHDGRVHDNEEPGLGWWGSVSWMKLEYLTEERCSFTEKPLAHLHHTCKKVTLPGFSWPWGPTETECQPPLHSPVKHLRAEPSQSSRGEALNTVTGYRVGNCSLSSMGLSQQQEPTWDEKAQSKVRYFTKRNHVIGKES